jgi:hypothetical protein
LSLVGHPVAVNPDSRLRAHARANGWQIHDYRTKRKAAKIGLPAAVMGVIAGAAAGAAFATRRHRRLIPALPPAPVATSRGRRSVLPV